MLSKLKKSLRNINYKLFTALLILGLAPTVYTTVRVFFLGQLPGERKIFKKAVHKITRDIISYARRPRNQDSVCKIIQCLTYALFNNAEFVL